MSLKRLGKLFVRYGGPTVKQGLDVVTNPKTYQGLAKNVDDVLQRKIPQAGVNIQNAPMSLLGKVNDIFDMAPGSAKEAARNQLQRNFRMADRLSQGAPVPRGGLSSTGALQAPSVGPQTLRRTGLSPGSATPPRPSFNAQDFRDIGGPQLRSSLRPKPTGTKLAGNLSLLKRIPKLGTVGAVGSGLYDLKEELDAGRTPVDALGRVVLGTAGGIIGGGIGTAAGITSGPGLFATGLAGSVAGYEAGAGLYDFLKGEMYPEVPADIIAIRERRLAKEGNTNKESNKTKQPSPMYGTIPPSVNTNLEAYDPGVTLPGGRRNVVEEIILDDNSPFVPTPNNLPSSPEALLANPLQQKMAEYEQGRAKATTQEEMNAVRDMGMAIYQAANPQMYEESYNPLMAATFPERYTKTPEDFIVQGGIQSPRGMTEKDAAEATAFGNKVQAIEGLDVDPRYNLFEAVSRDPVSQFEAAKLAAAYKLINP